MGNCFFERRGAVISAVLSRALGVGWYRHSSYDTTELTLLRTLIAMIDGLE